MMMGRDSDWVLPALVFVAFQYAVALTLSARLGFPHVPPLFGYFLVGMVVTVAGGVFLMLRSMWHLMAAGEQRPASALLTQLAANKSRILIGILGIQLVVLQIGSLTWLKSMMPLVVPFWADPMLADLDKAIFGTDPWRLLLWLKPAEPLIDHVYALWFPAKSLVMAAILISPPGFRKSRAALAYFFTVGLFGVLGQYAFSSAGPLFYEMAGFGTRFADMPLTPVVQTARAYLWNTYLTGGEAIGSGISAMPSVHVALAAWIALSLRSVFPRMAILGWTFFGFIMVGSVYLGWHYAVDGIAGTLAAAVSWKLAGIVVKGRARAGQGPVVMGAA
jgi:membrane-associated phospholipid phosphatase